MSDLAALDDAQLSDCLAALRQSLVKHRRAHISAIAAGRLSPSVPFSFPRFEWSPGATKTRKAPRWPDSIGPNTPIQELPLSNRAREALEGLQCRRLCEVARLSERELLRCDDIGKITVVKLTELLGAIGHELARSAR